MADARVLLIAYWFPPAGGIAVQRALSLARYLPQHGCQVHVLAPRNPPSPVIDPALLRQVPPEVTMHRAWTPMPPANLRKKLWGFISRPKPASAPKARVSTAAKGKGGVLSGLVQRLLCPDPEVVWVPFAARRARQIVKKHKIDTVIITAPPFSAFLIGIALKRQFPKLRLLSDFRDEWLRFFLSTFEFQKNAYLRQRAEAIERDIVEASSAVVTVTPSLVEELRKRYSSQPPEKFICIPNGYDPAAFAGFHSRAHEGSKIVVTYAGTVYSTTSPRCYFEALDSLPEDLRSRVETRFVGRIADDQKPLLSSRAGVKLLGYVPQAEALRCMEETDYLLLTMSDPTATTGKIYEYLATGKPIVAFSPLDGEVAHTLQETGGGWCIDPADSEATRSCVEQMATGKLIESFQPNLDAIRRYERPRLAGEFAAAIRGRDFSGPVGHRRV